MSQHDYNLSNESGASFRGDLNNALMAILSVNSGPLAPPTTIAHMLWFDETTGKLKRRNSANTGWVVLADDLLSAVTTGVLSTNGAITTTALLTAATLKITGGATVNGVMTVGPHGSASAAQVVNVCYGTAGPPAVGGVPAGSIFIKYLV